MKAWLSGGPRDGTIVELGRGYHPWVEFEEVVRKKDSGKIVSQRTVRYENAHYKKNRITVFMWSAT